MALRLALLLLLAAALVTSETNQCICTMQDNRFNMSVQRCSLDEKSGELVDCTNEIFPRVSSTYTYIPPQGLFSIFRIHLRYHHARVFCEQEGGRLAIPRSKEMFEKLQSLIKKAGIEDGAFLGLNDMETEGQWVDVDGHRPPALPWHKGEPNNKNDEDCGAVTRDRLLDDYNCWVARPFICERRLHRQIPAGYTWCNKAHRFYKVYQRERTFSEARKSCEDVGARLASIDTIEEAQCALSVFPALWNDPFVDFTDEAAEGQFVDSKGRLLDSMEFRVWRAGQPDNGGSRGPQNCVILVGTGMYTDISCDDTQPYLCELTPF